MTTVSQRPQTAIGGRRAPARGRGWLNRVPCPIERAALARTRWANRSACGSVAPHHADGPVLAVTPGKRRGFLGANRHIGPIGGGYRRRIAMRPIPGNVIGISVMHVARRRRRGVGQGFAGRPAVVVSVHAGPEDRASPVMTERPDTPRMESRMRRGTPSSLDRSRPRRCRVRGKHDRRNAERRDKRPKYSILHGAHHFVGYQAGLPGKR